MLHLVELEGELLHVQLVTNEVMVILEVLEVNKLMIRLPSEKALIQ